MKMRFILIIIVFGLNKICGQGGIDWTQLVGSWRIEKAVQLKDGDTVSTWFPDKVQMRYFKQDAKYIDSTSFANTVIAGNFRMDKITGIISFYNNVQTTKFPGSTYADYVASVSLLDIHVKVLSKEILIYFARGCDEADDVDCWSVTYLKKVE